MKKNNKRILNLTSFGFVLIFFAVYLSTTTSAFDLITFPTKIDTQQERINVQIVLNEVMVPSPNLKIDGVLGKKSIQAIQTFQELHELVPDGKIGPLTRGAFESSQGSSKTTSISGCIPGAVYNNQTGQRCTVTTTTVPTGCTTNTLFSPITGVSCNNPVNTPTTTTSASTSSISSNTNYCSGSSTKSCTIGNGTGIQNRTCNNGVWSGYTTCSPTSCLNGYQKSGNSCVTTSCTGSSTQSCTISNGQGIQSRTCNSGTWSSYGSCVVSLCNSGYQISGNGCALQTTTPTKIINVTASAVEDNNHLPTRTLDRLLDANYWSAEGDGQWISYELNQISTISYVKLAFYYNTQRYFDIKYSTNGTTWTNASSNLTSAPNMASQYQTFSFTPVNAKYIRIVGHGSSAPSLWNAIVETDINGFAIDLISTTPPSTPPVCTPESSSTTCSGKCGTQINNCGSSVSCGTCSSSDAVIVYYNNFEQNSLGKTDYKNSWTYCQTNPDASVYQNSADFGNTSKVFKALFPKGTYSLNNDYGFRCDYKTSTKYSELYLTYKVKFGNNFDAVLGGKLPRIEAGTVSAGNCPSGDKGFTGGMMFKKNSDGKPMPAFYIYYQDQWNNPYYRDIFYNLMGYYPSSCDDFFNIQKVKDYVGGVYGESIFWTNASLDPEKWYTITERVVANTPGQSNGFVEGYVDGNLVVQRGGFNFRNNTSVGLDYIDFTGFFGGGDDRFNTTKDENIYYDDVILYYYPSLLGQKTTSGKLPVINYPTTSKLR